MRGGGVFLMNTAERFSALFRGYSGAHGQTTVLDTQREGKKTWLPFIRRLSV